MQCGSQPQLHQSLERAICKSTGNQQAHTRTWNRIQHPTVRENGYSHNADPRRRTAVKPRRKNSQTIQTARFRDELIDPASHRRAPFGSKHNDRSVCASALSGYISTEIQTNKTLVNHREVLRYRKSSRKIKITGKRLVDLYLSSNLDVETINHKNDVIKKEIYKLTQKKVRLDPDNNSKEYTIELVKKLDCTEKNNTLFFTNIKNIGFAFLYDLLSREAKRDMIHRLISMIEIKRDKNYNIDIKDIKFTDEFITKSSKEYLKYLNNIMNDNNIGIKFHKEIDEIELKNMESNYDILSIMKMKNKELNPLEWTKLMNNYKNTAEEIVLNEYVFI